MTVPVISEAAFQSAVLDFAGLNGWKAMHMADSRREVVRKKTGARLFVGDRLARGWPDLTLVRGGVMVLAELKSERGRLSPEQREWLDALRIVAAAAPGVVLVRVWTPASWPDVELTLALTTYQRSVSVELAREVSNG